MKTKSTRSPKNDKKFASPKAGKSVKRASASTESCAHCGGMIKHAFDDNSCVMCGRRSGHSCPNCMCKEGAAAA